MPQRRLRRRHPHVTFRTKREREAIIQKWMGSQWRPANSRARLGCFNHSAVVAARARASPPLIVAKKVKDSRIKTPIHSMVRAHFSRHRAVDRSLDRKSTRLNSSHLVTSYAVFCLKKKSNVPPTLPV